MLKNRLIKRIIALMCVGALSIVSVASTSAYMIDSGSASGTLGGYSVSGSVTLNDDGAGAQTSCSYSNAGRQVTVQYVYSVYDEDLQETVIRRISQTQSSGNMNSVASVSKDDASCAALAGGGKHYVGFNGYSWKKITKAGQDKLVTLSW